MKNKLLLMGLCMSVMACSDDNSTSVVDDPQTQNKVVMLKVDVMTSAFEGGKELTFEDASTFTISHQYNTPGDFGSIQLKYDELDAPIFDGTVHWMGLGEISYPATMESAASFETMDVDVSLPDASQRELIVYDEFMPNDEWPYAPDYAALWGAVDNLKVVKDYREANPNAKVHFFLYTPSVGSGDPAEWDWFIILKN
ncbi:hypothetical protein ACX0HA_16455 [Flavobacterium hauense]